MNSVNSFPFSFPVIYCYTHSILFLYLTQHVNFAFALYMEAFVTEMQGVLSWRASGDRQIPLSASDERAFANFRVKNVVFTGTHFCAVLSMVGERVFVNFRKFVN